MTSAARDPQGKRALFDPSQGDAAEGLIRPTVPSGQSGKKSLFEAAERRPLTVVMHCSECGGKSRVGVVEFAKRHFPFWLWIPGKRHSRLLRCANCETLTWQSVSFLS